SARVQAVRLTDSVIVVDGALDEPAWQRAPAASTFWQVQPDEGQPSSERTEVRILYTADTLYVGVLCHDREPGGIVVADSRRDSSLTETDSFTMILDTYRDRQNGFVFGTNPAGIEYDGQVTNEGQGGGGLAAGQMQSSGAGSGFNLNWDGAWTVKTRLTGDGWTAEFAIPFKTLRFPAGEIQTWGINFQRNIRRRNERAFWSPIPRQYDLNRVSLAGEVSGIAVPALRNLKVTPYALANALASGADPVDGVVLGDVGGDLKYTLTPSLALDATVNTDFAQVEVDEQQVNLDRFNLFFPEKRPFFLENAGFFTVGNPGEVDLFFSRRIGLAADGETIPILAGARVSGKAGPYNIGVLEMQTDGRRGEPGDNFAVVRVSRDLPNRSAFGGIFVNRQGVGDEAPDDDHNRTYALDGKIGIGQNAVVSGFVARTQTPGVDAGREYAFNVRGRTNRPRYDVELGYQEVGERFNPEVGFLSRSGYRKPDARLMTRFRPKDFLSLQELRPHVSYRAFWGFDGFLESSFTHIDNHWQFRNAYEVHTGMNLTVEGVRVPFQIYPGVFVRPGTYRNAEAQLVFMTNQGAPVSLNLTSYIGGFFGGDRVTLNPVVRARLGDRLTSELSYSRNDVRLPEGDFTTNLARLRVSYSFTTRSFLQGLVQYNDRADLWSMNLRFGWLQAANTGLFIVYNDTRYLYDLVARPERTDRSLVVKFSRMFDVLR
ncbi:MAG: carbohydrate binding family 9 domain-containing protein, partial [Vicinamibacterales bacterium]|nr:carbohydrate binding family 9 domain-containing protein [Vicinamibacterales bacterium]